MRACVHARAPCATLTLLHGAPQRDAPCPTDAQAEKLQGCVLLVDAASRQAPRSRDEFFVTDVIGCKVYHKVRAAPRRAAPAA